MADNIDLWYGLVIIVAGLYVAWMLLRLYAACRRARRRMEEARRRIFDEDHLERSGEMLRSSGMTYVRTTDRCPASLSLPQGRDFSDTGGSKHVYQRFQDRVSGEDEW